MKKKLNIAILIDDFVIQSWEYKILVKIADSDSSVLKLVIKDDAKPREHMDHNFPFVYRIHEKLDRYLFKHKFNYDTKIDISDFVAEIPCIFFDSKSGEAFPGRFEQEIDVILKFGVSVHKNSLQDLPKYGVWSYRIVSSGDVTEHFAGYWETMKNLPLIEGAVFMHSAEGHETKIYCTNAPTYPESIHQVRDRIYAAAAVVIPRILKGLFENGNAYLETLVSNFNRENDPGHPGLFKPPSSIEALGNLFILAKKKIERKFHPDLWFLLLSKQHDNEFPFTLDPGKFIELRPPQGVFWADPFIINRDNKYYLFIEEYVYRTNKGHISVLELDGDGVLLSSEIIIKQAYHMSYPFIFEWENEYYMVPETMQNKTIGLYHCKKFPNEWEPVMDLMENVTAVDSTLFYRGQKWWLFTSIDETGTFEKPFNELFLFFTDDLFSGQWKHHPLNPIVTDLRASRPAGKIVIHNNKIYRPSQDCSERYGRAMKINEITKLSESEYEETLVMEIEPTWNHGLLATHTINFDGPAAVLDACEQAGRKPS
jgi:hypothetical protein